MASESVEVRLLKDRVRSLESRVSQMARALSELTPSTPAKKKVVNKKK
ncbi:MAG: hypothetical protein Greene07147_716 [Parcubacteria group bacterium Greene0714_7]|nr:MAG: hypothetical protein Greene07147_716 [Parcubacteria group bacterium Greene0714_7]